MRTILSVMMLVVAFQAEADGAPVTLLADQGKARLPVVHAENASPRVRQAAATLAAYLGKISGASFAIERSEIRPGFHGIFVGLAANFPGNEVPWTAQDPTHQEDYQIRSTGSSLHLVGASELAVEHAVWDCLYRLGYRQFFPGPHWEIVPARTRLEVDFNAVEHPSYYSRRIWYGFGAAKWSQAHYASWCAKNRCVAGIALNTGHAYPGFYQRHKDEFAKHPEYLSLLNGQRRFAQFCIANPGLRRLIADDALAQFARNPELQSISVDPNDGGGWCECDECRKFGSVSNRAVTLANFVAEAVNEQHPGKFVGMYAYNQHSPPPTIAVHPRVVISVATAFISGGHTVDQLLEGWQKQKATLGIREYYSVHTWDRDLPGRARGANPAYLAKTIPHFHSKGARFLSAESSDNWGCNGLGYYLAARMLWNVDEAKRVNALTEDFLDKAFGPAQQPMREYYHLIDAAQRPLLTDDLVGRMYRHLDKARGLTQNPAILARIDDLVLYTLYVDQWLDYTGAKGMKRQEAYEGLMKHVYRMRDRLMVHTLAVARDVPGRDKALVVPPEAKFNVPPGKNPWISSTPFLAADIETILARGIDTRKLLDFVPVSFSGELVPATGLGLDKRPALMPSFMTRGPRHFYTWVPNAPATITLQATAGLIYRDKGPAIFQLYPALEPAGKAVADAKVAPDRTEHEVKLTTTFTGLHRIEVADKTAGTRITWPESVPLTIASSHEDPTNFTGRWSLYFYVPKGTKVVGGYSAGPGAMLDAGGKKIFEFAAKGAYFQVSVPQGQDGKVWKMHQCAGERILMTVPSVFARSPQDLLLPADVVHKDKGL